MTDPRSGFHATLADNWLTFRRHHPVGAYLPVGQLDGDCHGCGEAWPCATVRAILDPALDVVARAVDGTPLASGEPATPPPRPSARVASAKQANYVRQLLDHRIVPDDLAARAEAALEATLRRADAEELIPLLLACPSLPPRSRDGWEQAYRDDGRDVVRRSHETDRARFDREMCEANGEEYPGACTHNHGSVWP